MTAFELRSSLALAAVSGLRLLGMFIILPVFALYAETLPGGASHTMIGIALGAYGLTQALLQVPFGWASDRWGRKPTIYVGLLLFAAGSFIAASASDIYWVTAGRIVQGSGAVSAAVIALTADLTREVVRTKAMAIIGVTIGVTFAVSMVLGPVLDRWIGVPGIFALTGILAIAAMALVRFGIADPAESIPVLKARASFGEVFLDPQLQRLNVGIFVLHAILMALFVVVPFGLRSAGLPASEHWTVYLPVMAASFVMMVPLIAYSERNHRHREAFVTAIGLLLVSVAVMMALERSVANLFSGLLIFFFAFNFLEASLPSLVSRVAPAHAKGAAVGVYSSIQFLGTALGAAAGGWLSHHGGESSVFMFCGVLALVWLVVAFGMSVPVTKTYPVPPMDSLRADGLVEQLGALPGVKEVRILSSGDTAQLKVDTARFDEDNALKLIHGEMPQWLPSTK
ncbi:MAG: MFS transporter [Betaproteobacteria bacterium]|nr:MFS transporter [Betaproteobacteria bacterium]MBL8533853.1 MFS transporter [Betaproteobacteria bacterium]